MKNVKIFPLGIVTFLDINELTIPFLYILHGLMVQETNHW